METPTEKPKERPKDQPVLETILVRDLTVIDGMKEVQVDSFRPYSDDDKFFAIVGNALYRHDSDGYYRLLDENFLKKE